MTWELGGFAVAVVFSALYSGSETGIYAVNRLRLEMRAQTADDHAARALDKLVSSQEALLCVLLIGNNIANEATTILAEHIVSGFLTDVRLSTLVTTAVLTPLLFVLGEALPKQLFRQHAESWAYRVTPFLQLSRIVLAPLWLLVLPVARLANRLARGRAASGFRHDEFALERLLSSANQQVDPVREAALGIGSRQNSPVRDVLVPLDRIRWLESDATIEDLRKSLQVARHSRYPIREEDGEFRSYVYFLDAFHFNGRANNLKEVARPLIELPVDAALEDALDVLERASSRVAVVKDASGQALGFVFAADVVAGLLASS
ncbi:MAG: DUF21 domain-containing protein [Planctomycetes bacterium]|nr:DUF21 domain-containing protein [Planctomycetota bacterium]